jgi:RNA polymerase sigma factor (sigma-70 family)
MPFDVDQPFKPYLMRMAHNVFVDHVKAESRRPATLPDALEAPDRSPEEELQQRESDQAVLNALRHCALKLLDREELIFLLLWNGKEQHREGNNGLGSWSSAEIAERLELGRLSQTEIGQRLDRSPAQVHQIKTRVLEKLRHSLAGLLKDQG